jgi:anti-anti-sigma regulatory factor
MWKVRRAQNGDATVFKLIGRLESDQLNELQEVLASEASTLDLILDLTDVRLIDQDTVRFLADCDSGGAIAELSGLHSGMDRSGKYKQ